MHMMHIFVKKQNVCKLFLFRILNMNLIFCLILAGGSSTLDPSNKKEEERQQQTRTRLRLSTY